MRACLLFFTVVILISCNDNDIPSDEAAINKACEKCNLSAPEMNWLAVKIKESKTSLEKNGSFYAISTSVGVVIVYQQVIMSCLGCQRFDCHGNTPTLSEAVVINELVPGMNAANLILQVP